MSARDVVDTELLQHLADADARSPVPPGQPLTPERLRAGHRRRQRRAALLATALVLLLGLPALLRVPFAVHESTGTPRATPVAALVLDVGAEANALLVRLERLHQHAAELQHTLTAALAADRDAAEHEALRSRHRCQLAFVRAGALLGGPSPDQPMETHR